MQIYPWHKLNASEQKKLLARPSATSQAALQESIRGIVDDIARNGDEALIRYALRYDRVDLRTIPVQVGPQEFTDAYKKIDPAIVAALQSVIAIVQNFAETEMSHVKETHAQPHPGIQIRSITTPIDSCALYVPFGSGRFPSMVYMQGIPAKCAGVSQVQLLIPPQKDGSIDPACLVAADLCGITRVYRVGGAHGIAACAYGTDSIPAVAKILGPGSAVVSTAKQLVRSVCDTGPVTGPSESMIISDEHADPAMLAAHILIEAEHGLDSMALLLSNNRKILQQTADIVAKLIAETPEAQRGWLTRVMDRSFIEVDSLETACRICNTFAPEHLQLQVEDPQSLIPHITYAGEILIGAQTPFSLANYAGGASAVLPTGGYARSASALSVHDFLKTSAIIEADKAKTQLLRQQVVSLADYEGFYHHARACKD